MGMDCRLYLFVSYCKLVLGDGYSRTDKFYTLEKKYVQNDITDLFDYVEAIRLMKELIIEATRDRISPLFPPNTPPSAPSAVAVPLQRKVEPPA